MTASHPPEPGSAARTVLLVPIGIALVLLVLFGNLNSNLRWALVLSDAAHGPVSAAIAIILMRLMSGARRPAAPLPRWVGGIALTTLIGILIELIQAQIGRDAEVSDVVTDVLGAIAGTGWYITVTHDHAFAGTSARMLRMCAIVTATLATTALSIPVVTMAGAYAAKSTRGAVLIDANAPLGTYFLTAYWLLPHHARMPAKWQSPDQTGGLLIPADRLTDGAQRWGLSVDEVPPDWHRFDSLVIDMVNPGPTPMRLRLRIFDRDDGLSNTRGFITTLDLPASTRTVSTIRTADIATGENSEPIDLDHVRGLVIDSPVDHPQSAAHPFYLVRLALDLSPVPDKR